MSSDYAERRVLSLLLISPERAAETHLRTEDFLFDYHRLIFGAIVEKRTGEILVLDLPDEVRRYALNLDENWAPTNLCAFARIVLGHAEQRRFALAVRKLSGATEKAFR